MSAIIVMDNFTVETAMPDMASLGEYPIRLLTSELQKVDVRFRVNEEGLKDLYSILSLFWHKTDA